MDSGAVDSLEVKRKGLEYKGSIPVEAPGDAVTDCGKVQEKGTQGGQVWGTGLPVMLLSSTHRLPRQICSPSKEKKKKKALTALSG